MMNLLKQFGCIWVRERQEIVAGKIITIFLGYIINERGVAQPTIAAVKGTLTDEERKQLQRQLNFSQQIVLGELDTKWKWHYWDGEKMTTPPIYQSKQKSMEREADINMVFLTLFASLNGLPPNVIRELVNAALLTRIYLQETDAENEWATLTQFPEKFIFHALHALRHKKIEQIVFIPYINREIVLTLIHHIQALPVRSLALARSYLAFSLLALKEEFDLNIAPSYWVEDVLDDLKTYDAMKGQVADLSSIFSSKLIYCMNNEDITELIGVEESAHFVPQAKMFALLSGDARVKIHEQWKKNFQADTVLAEINRDNIFRLAQETNDTLRQNGYGCWFMEATLESLARTLLETGTTKYQLKEFCYYESPALGNWVAIIFQKR